MRDNSWEAQQRAEIVMGLVTSLRIAHDHHSTVVFWPTLHWGNLDQERRALTAGWNSNGGGRDRNGGDAIVAEAVVAAVVAVVTEAPPDARVGVAARAEAATGMAASTTATEAAEEAMEAVDTAGAAKPPVRGAAAKGATATPRVEDTGSTRAQAPTELTAAAPRRTEGREQAVKETPEWAATLGAAEPPAREATGGSRAQALTNTAAPAPRRTAYRVIETEETLE